MRFVSAKFTQEEWEKLVDRIISMRGDMKIKEMLEEVLMSMSEDELGSVEVKDVDSAKVFVIKSAPIRKELAMKLKKVAMKKGVEMQRLLAEAVLYYFGFIILM